MVIARSAVLLLLVSLVASAQEHPVPAGDGSKRPDSVDLRLLEDSDAMPVMVGGGPKKTDTEGPDVIEASRLMDDVHCADDVTLAKVEALLSKAIAEASPKINVGAQVEKARRTMIVGSNCTSRVADDALVSAREDLELALLADPDSTAALIQIAQVSTQMGRYADALGELKKAEALGSRSAQLYVYRGLTYIAMHDLKAAGEALSKVPACRVGQTRREQCGGRLGMRTKIDLYDAMNDQPAVLRAYREAIAAFPTSAFMHGNLATYLLYKVGDLDGALAEIDKAKAISDYGQLHTTQAIARYAQWAKLRNTNPAAAKQLRQQAETVVSADAILPQIACGIGGNPATQGLATALIQEGVSIDALDDDFTALMTAASCGQPADLSWLLAKRASQQATNSNGFTAFALAAYMGRLDNVEALLPTAPLNAADNEGNTPLMLALIYGHDAVALRLVQAKADVNRGGSFGDTPLIRATQGGYAPVVRALLDAGADTAPRSKHVPLNAAEWAEKMGRKDLAEMIRGQKR